MTTKKTERPPVIAVLGHVDHGKSSLLDYIRRTNIVAGEAGGITQHLGAYEVTHDTKNGARRITFLDTPGHAAFAAMRARGAKIADIAILVVSAEEGVKAQTIEALNAIRDAKLPYLIAFTKIDRPGSNVEKAKQQLAEQEVLVESYGGQIPSAEVSSKTGVGIPELLDLVLLVAELSELTTDQNLPGTGAILESRIDPKMGVLATVVIKDGTLNQGDYIVAGTAVAKVKKMENDNGQTITTANASTPVRVFGFLTLPPIGEIFTVCTDKKLAEAAANANKTVTTKQITDTGDTLIIPIILKADVAGTLEAVAKAIEGQGNEIVGVKIVHQGLGAIGENDLRAAVGAKRPVVLGFHVKLETAAREFADRLGVTIETFDIIYKLTEWLAEEIVRRTPKTEVDLTIGTIKIIKLFSREKDKQIIGAQVMDGVALKGKPIRISRRDTPLGNGKITSLRLTSEEVKEVPAGQQFGAQIESKIILAPGDTLTVLDSELETA